MTSHPWISACWLSLQLSAAMLLLFVGNLVVTGRRPAEPQTWLLVAGGFVLFALVMVPVLVLPSRVRRLGRLGRRSEAELPAEAMRRGIWWSSSDRLLTVVVVLGAAVGLAIVADLASGPNQPVTAGVGLLASVWIVASAVVERRRRKR
jgi:hypothetical protein